MKLFVAGAPCSGKSTISRLLREQHGVNALDMDDLILRHNGGVWPDIPTKNEIVRPRALAEVLTMDEVVLFAASMEDQDMRRLREAGFRTALLDVTPEELRRRDAKRQAEEGWTNIEWFDWNQAAIQRLRDGGHIDIVIPAERTAEEIAASILAIDA